MNDKWISIASAVLLLVIKTKPNQTKPNQTKPNQTKPKPNQTKPKQNKTTQDISLDPRVHWQT